MTEADSPVAAASAAERSGRRVEVTDAKSETGQTWANPDGTFTSSLASGPVRFKTSGGDWREIDLTARAGADGSITAAAAERAVTLPATAAGSVSIPTDAGPIGISHPDATAAAPVLDGSIVTYPGAVGGRDLVQQLLVHGVEETVVMDTAADSPSFATTFTLPAGVTAANAPGEVQFTDSAGKLLGRYGAGVAFDEAGAHAPVSTVLTAQGGRRASVNVAVDAAWARSAERRGKIWIDPVYAWSTSSGGSSDTYVTSGTPTTNYGSSGDLRVGYFSATDTSRALVQIAMTSLVATNMTVQDADLTLYNHQSSPCQHNATSVYGNTASWSAGSATWNTKPAADAAASGSLAFGATPCPSGSVNIDVTGLAQDWAEQGQPGFRSNFGVTVRGPETSSSGWKKFKAAEYGSNPPTLTITYNRRPNTPTQLATTPTTPCRTGTSRPFISTTTPKFTGTAMDLDSVNSRVLFDIWPTGGSGTFVSGWTPGGAPGIAKSWTVPSGTPLSNNVNYSWRTLAQDSISNGLSYTGWCEFTVDTIVPATPTISSATYTAGNWQPSNAAADFTFSSTGHTDVTTWAYRFDTGSFVNVTQAAGGANSTKTVNITPPAGWQALHVIGIDRAGNRTPETTYSFGAGPAVTSPSDGAATQQSVKLKAVAATGNTGVTFAYKLPDAASWTTIPTTAVTYPGGGAISSWPLTTTTVGSTVVNPDVNLNVAALLTPSGGSPVDGAIMIKADFVNGSTTTSTAGTPTVTLNQNAFGSSFATETVGPGSVSLLTGNYSLSSTDVSVTSYGSDLTLSRTFNSKTPSTTGGIFGPGWSASLGVDAAGSDFTTLTDLGSTVQVTSGDGSLMQFLNKTGGYVAAGDAEGMKLTAGGALGSGPGSFTLLDPDGNKTVFSVTSSWGSAAGLGTPHNYPPTSVIQPGSNQTTSYTYSGGLPVRILAPTPGGVSCPAWPSAFSGAGNMGCRSLDLAYGTVNGQQQVYSATERTTDGAGNTVNVALACYGYNTNGSLAVVWDPRINNTACVGDPVASDLPTSYGYDPAGRVATFYPPGLALWQLQFDGSTGKFTGAYRTHSATWGSGTETSTVVYDVPIGNDANATTGLHPDLSAGTAATWAQNDLPTTATAVYNPGDSIGSGAAGDYRDGVIYALNVAGREVNTATYTGTGQAGWKIDTTEYDDDGHVLRTLDAANRDRALRRADMPAVSVDLPASTSEAARMLDTTNIYQLNPNDTSVETGTDLDLVDTFGPLHLVVIPDAGKPEGVTIAARSHTHTNYDTGSETGHPAPVQSLHLPVSSYTEASPSPGVYTGLSTGTTANDPRTTTLSYTIGASGASTGWDFRTPLQTTVTPGGGAATITTTTTLDATTGIVTKTSQPSDVANNRNQGYVDTTSTTYYAAGATNNAACINSAWYMQVCKTQPAAQITPRPSGMADLPVTSTTYDWLLRPQTITQSVTDSAGNLQTRTSSTTYENGGTSPRPLSTSTTNSISSGPQVLPTVTTTYDTTTGASLTVSDGTKTLTTGYDDFGRPVSFTDADGGTTTTSYDSRGRVASTSEVFSGVTLRTTTLGYDGGNEHRGLTTSSSTTDQGGAFTAVYDAGGSLLSQTYPNGILASYTSDESGDTTRLLYSKSGTEWFADAQASNIHGQWRTHDGLPSTQVYSYDGAGRLTETRDSSKTSDTSDWDCQARKYTFDVNSNRTSLVSYPNNGTDGGCQTSTGATTVNNTFDAADRLTATGRATGITYDAFGRTLLLPAALTTVSGTGGTAVTQSYYANDLILSQTAGSTVRTWQLDPSQQRFRTYTDNSTGPTVTKTNHYSDSASDSPDWIDEGNGTQTRYSTGLDGNLATTDTRTTSTWVVNGLTFQLTNLHGDIVTTATPTATLYDGAVRDTDEYGNPKTAITGRYGWLGGKQRSTEAFGSLTLMGVRLYTPVLGRFLQTDPIKGGSANSYDYVNQDPINNFDLDGRWCGLRCRAKKAWGAAKSAGSWAKSRNWGDFVGATGNVYFAFTSARTAVGLAAFGALGCGAPCFAAAGGFGVASYSRAKRATWNVREGLHRCTSRCSVRGQLTHAGQDMLPTPLGPSLRCRRGGCHHYRYRWWDI